MGPVRAELMWQSVVDATEIAGPGGKATLTENNERGILDAVVFRAMSSHREASLGSSHDAHAQGIYKDSGEKYGD
jgi:hypothetical protein